MKNAKYLTRLRLKLLGCSICNGLTEDVMSKAGECMLRRSLA